jgi:hypothetical protein
MLDFLGLGRALLYFTSTLVYLYETYSLVPSLKFRSIISAHRHRWHAHLCGGGYGIRRSETIQSLAIGE